MTIRFSANKVEQCVDQIMGGGRDAIDHHAKSRLPCDTFVETHRRLRRY
jgi:hypothetical protein